jgi:hypothetical protein
MKTTSAALEQYLKELQGELKAHGVDDAGDLAREIRSHVREATGEHGDETEIARALESFGPPSQLAATVASERYAGSVDTGPRPAPPIHRVFAFLLDVLWVAGPPVVLGVAGFSPLTWATDLLGNGGADTARQLVALILEPAWLIGVAPIPIAGAWLFIAARTTTRAVRAGRPTVGMRAAGLTTTEVSGERLVLRMTTALAAGSPPPAHRGRAVAGIVVASAIVALAVLQFLMLQSPFMDVLTARSFDGSRVANDYAVGVVSSIYEVAMSGDPETAPDMREVFRGSGTTFDEFAGRLVADGIRGWKGGAGGYRATIDGSATVEVSTQEWTDPAKASPAYRDVFFTFAGKAIDPGEEVDPAEIWTLVKVVRDPLGRAVGGPSAAEAREVVDAAVNESTIAGEEGVGDGRERMTDSFAASETAAALLPGATERLTVEKVPAIDSIEFVDRFAMVRTTEWWSRIDADPMVGEERHYLYRVVLFRGAAVIDGRQRVD